MMISAERLKELRDSLEGIDPRDLDSADAAMKELLDHIDNTVNRLRELSDVARENRGELDVDAALARARAFNTAADLLGGTT